MKFLIDMVWKKKKRYLTFNILTIILTNKLTNYENKISIYILKYNQIHKKLRLPIIDKHKFHIGSTRNFVRNDHQDAFSFAYTKKALKTRVFMCVKICCSTKLFGVHHNQDFSQDFYIKQIF